MGKKGTWFSAIKRVFTSNSKDKPLNNNNEGEKKKSRKENKGGGGGGRLKHVSFIPALFKEPSSIEKILGEVDQHNLFIGHHHPHPTTQSQSQAQPPSSSSGRPLSPPRVTSPPRVATSSPPRAAVSSPPRAAVVHRQTEISHTPEPEPQPQPQPQSEPTLQQQHRQTEISHTPEPEPQPQPQSEPTLQQQHLSATGIQAAYRGYVARRKLRGLNGLVRLQGLVRGQNVKRQTVNAMKQMQLLVRVQTQIQSRRIQMLENQALKRQSKTNDKQVEANNLSERGDEYYYWDDSLITKEEREGRLQKKVEAVIKRERSMAYAYSRQLGKATPTSAAHLIDIRSDGYHYRWWWNWLEGQLPSPTQPPPLKNHHQLASSRLTPDHKLSPRRLDHLDTPTTPMSSRSMAPSRTRQQTTPSTTTTPSRMMMMMKYSISKARRGGGYPMKDDDSMMSCPAFSVPNYMSPTISAKAKARPTSNPKDRATPCSTPGSTQSSSKRRFSFPFTPNSNKHKSPGSVGNFSSMDSAISLGRKPFNRFV